MKPVDYTGCKEVPHCGTTAIAIISEKPVAEVLEIIREFRGDRQDPNTKVGGLEDFEIFSVLDGLSIYPSRGWSMPGRKSTVRDTEGNRDRIPGDACIRTEKFVLQDSSLAAFCKSLGSQPGPFLVLIDNPAFGTSLHAIVVSSGQICCSMTEGKPVPMYDYRYLNSEVIDFRKY